MIVSNVLGPMVLALYRIMLEGCMCALINICVCTDSNEAHEPMLSMAWDKTHKIQNVPHAWIRMDPAFPLSG